MSEEHASGGRHAAPPRKLVMNQADARESRSGRHAARVDGPKQNAAGWRENPAAPNAQGSRLGARIDRGADPSKGRAVPGGDRQKISVPAPHKGPLPGPRRRVSSAGWVFGLARRPTSKERPQSARSRHPDRAHRPSTALARTQGHGAPEPVPPDGDDSP